MSESSVPSPHQGDATSDVTIVTGGGSGMGRQIAIDLVASGKSVVVIGRRRKPLLETASLSRTPDLVEPIVADLSSAEGVESVKTSLSGRRIKGIVSAAGGQGSFYSSQPESSDDVLTAWSEAMDKNLYSAVLPIESLLPSMIDGRGRIVLIGSTAGLDGQGGPYATAKAALHGYGRDLAVRLAERRITANVVAPGFVGDTEFFEHIDTGRETEEMAVQAARMNPLGRVGVPTDISSCVLWLLDENAGWITGQTITISGGTHLVR